MLEAKFALENDFAELLYAESVGDAASIFTDTKQHVKNRHNNDGKKRKPRTRCRGFRFL
jgi:hypothetical protein